MHWWLLDVEEGGEGEWDRPGISFAGGVVEVYDGVEVQDGGKAVPEAGDFSSSEVKEVPAFASTLGESSF
jgi:hypothetical protein